MSPRRYVPVVASCLAALACLAGPAQAGNGPMQAVVGTKGPVSIPVHGDAQTMFRMPSSIAWSLDHQVDIDLFGFWSSSQMKNSLNDFDKTSGTYGGSLGLIIAPGRAEDEFDGYGGKFTLGIGLYPDLAGGGGKSSKVRLQTFPNTVGVRKGILFLNLTFAAAYAPTDWLGFGIGLHTIYSSLNVKTLVGGSSTPLAGSPQIADGMNFPGNPTYADFLDLLGNDDGTDPSTRFTTKLSSVQFGASVSISLRPTDWLGFGISYRPRSWDPLHFEGEAEIDATTTITQLGPTVQSLLIATLPGGGTEFAANDFAGDYDIDLSSVRVPRQARISVVVWPTERLLIAGEVGWVEWHRAFRKTVVKLTKGDNSDLNFVVGSSTINTVLDSRWRNRWVGSLYVAFGVTDWLTLRAGVNHMASPFNDAHTGVAPNPGIVETNLSFGAGLRFGALELSFLVEHGFHSSDRSTDEPEAVTAKRTYYGASQWFFHGGMTIRF